MQKLLSSVAGTDHGSSDAGNFTFTENGRPQENRGGIGLKRFARSFRNKSSNLTWVGHA